MAVVMGHNVLGKIVESLGMKDQYVTRIVIDIKVKDVARIYVERMVDEKSLLQVIDIMLAEGQKFDTVEFEGKVELEPRPDGVVDVTCAESGQYAESKKCS